MMQVTQDGLTVRRVTSADKDEASLLMFNNVPLLGNATLDTIRTVFDKYCAGCDNSDRFIEDGDPITENDGFRMLLGGRYDGVLVNLILVQVSRRNAIPLMVATEATQEGEGHFGRLIDCCESILFDRLQLDTIQFKTRAAYNPYEARMGPRNLTTLRTYTNGDKLQSYTRAHFDSNIKTQRSTTPTFIG